jgi:hypothetical protein
MDVDIITPIVRSPFPTHAEAAPTMPHLWSLIPWRRHPTCFAIASAVLLPLMLPLIVHTEARVSTATAKLCGGVAAVLGPIVWDETSAVLLLGIERNFGLNDQQRLREAERVVQRDMRAGAA